MGITTVTPPPPPSLCDVDFPDNQFHVCYFDGTSAPTGESAVLSQSTEATLDSSVGVWSGFDHDWGTGEVDDSGKADQVSATWRGRINFQAGDYVFHTNSDDGVELYIDDIGNVIDQWGAPDHDVTQDDSGVTAISGGYRNVMLRWREVSGEAVIRLWWDYDDGSGGGSCDPEDIQCNCLANGGSADQCDCEADGREWYDE